MRAGEEKKAELGKVRVVSGTAQGLGLLLTGFCGCGPFVALLKDLSASLKTPICLREEEEESEDKEKAEKRHNIYNNTSYGYASFFYELLLIKYFVVN